MSPELSRNSPATLYEIATKLYVSSLNYNVNTLLSVQNLRLLPTCVIIDIYAKMSEHDELKDMLLEQLSDLDTFERLLNSDPARQKLFVCLTALMSGNRNLAEILCEKFIKRYPAPKKIHAKNFVKKLLKANADKTTKTKTKKTTKFSKTEETNDETAELNAVAASASKYSTAGDAQETAAEIAELHINVISFGLRLGSFLAEAGWLSQSIEILSCMAAHLRKMPVQNHLMRLDCLQRLLQSESLMCNFQSAQETYHEIKEFVKTTDLAAIPNALMASLYTQYSAMHFARSEYNESHLWSSKAIDFLDEKANERVIIDTLRQGAKSCVLKRDFQRANLLICQATLRAKKKFGESHQKYADALLDYGFFLLNVDSVFESVKMYKEALDIKRCILGNRNLHVAVAHEDLSYAFYVHEYSTGNFACAREHVELAVAIMKDLVPRDHLKLASAKRVKALLLEEIALDKMADGMQNDEDNLLKQSEELHKYALQLSLDVFGEMNVQTAKHYGNLGRLYQTMNRFEEAERMHQKAIKIKSFLLGPYDFEVGLSIGHLASLYNYQMKKYREAEELYMRSIEISLRLFGKSYSGLEYDYLGLCHVYEVLQQFEDYLKYATILENWNLLRTQNGTLHKSTYPAMEQELDMADIKLQYNLNPCKCKVPNDSNTPVAKETSN